MILVISAWQNLKETILLTHSRNKQKYCCDFQHFPFRTTKEITRITCIDDTFLEHKAVYAHVTFNFESTICYAFLKRNGHSENMGQVT